jgi:hypothetical protein
LRHFKSNYTAAVITATCANSRLRKHKRPLPPPHPLQGLLKFGEGKETERIFKTLGFFELILKNPLTYSLPFKGKYNQTHFG